jgi:DNA-binding NtrC family response regulator
VKFLSNNANIKIFKTLRPSLFCVISLLVILSGIMISQIAIINYSNELLSATIAHGENIAHKLAPDSSDKILRNDLAAVQNILDDQLRTEPDISQAHYKSRIKQLGIKVNLITAGILAIALLLSYFLITSLLRPLILLIDAVKNINEEELPLPLKGTDEIFELVSAYNGMLEKINKYTKKLQKSNQSLAQKNKDIDRLHNQMMTTFSIAGQIATMSDMQQIGSFLIESLRNIVPCGDKSIIVFDTDRGIAYLIMGNSVISIDKKDFESLYTIAGQKRKFPVFQGKEAVETWHILFPKDINICDRMAIFSFHHHHQLLGAILVACPCGCKCAKTEIDMIQMMLKQVSGVMYRALEYDKEINNLKSKIDTGSGYQSMVGRDPTMQTVYKLIEDVAPTDAGVLIQGESGTGKELVAKAIHLASKRADKPFIVINCSAYPPTLLETELFGHEKGAFTGGAQFKKGRFELASGGTVFLDEIGEISMSAQTMLLRVLQNKTIERIGGGKSIKVDIRMLAATNRNLWEEVKKEKFRRDLYYRLNVIPINLPPLRERKSDIPLLIDYFLKKFASEQKKTIQRIDSETTSLLLAYHWPGNVRELENSIRHAVTLAKSDKIYAFDFPEQLLKAMSSQPRTKSNVLTSNEARIIVQVLDECNWNKTVAAKNLGISRSTLYEKLKKYEIKSP